MITTIFYSVSNGGDGSAYPHFFYDQICAKVHQDIVNSGEGWGESCTGCLNIHHNPNNKSDQGDIHVDNCLSKQEYLHELKKDLDDYIRYSETTKYYNERIKVIQKGIEEIEADNG